MTRWGDERRGVAGGGVICGMRGTSVGVEIEREIVCAICQVLQRRFSWPTLCVGVCVLVCFLLQNAPSGLFIESPSPLSAFAVIISERAAGNVVRRLSVA